MARRHPHRHDPAERHRLRRLLRLERSPELAPNRDQYFRSNALGLGEHGSLRRQPPEREPRGAGRLPYNLRFPGSTLTWRRRRTTTTSAITTPRSGGMFRAILMGLMGGLNTYGYVGARPLALIDPWGLAPGGGRSWRPQPSPPVPLPWDPGFGPNNCSHYPVPALRSLRPRCARQSQYELCPEMPGSLLARD